MGFSDSHFRRVSSRILDSPDDISWKTKRRCDKLSADVLGSKATGEAEGNRDCSKRSICAKSVLDSVKTG